MGSSGKRAPTDASRHGASPLPSGRVLYRKNYVRHPFGLPWIFVLFGARLFYVRVEVGDQRRRRVPRPLYFGDGYVLFFVAVAFVDDGLYFAEEDARNVCIR